jgi:hypothetical protein
MLYNYGYRHTIRMCNTHCFFQTTVTRTLFNITLYVHCYLLFNFDLMSRQGWCGNVSTRTCLDLLLNSLSYPVAGTKYTFRAYHNLSIPLRKLWQATLCVKELIKTVSGLPKHTVYRDHAVKRTMQSRYGKAIRRTQHHTGCHRTRVPCDNKLTQIWTGRGTRKAAGLLKGEQEDL